jgi:hypothetical protein
VRLDIGQGTPLEHRPLASTTPVMVETGAFEEALARLVLADARWRALMARSYGGPCKPGQRGTTCLSLLDDVLGWDQWDKLGIALALSFEPIKASISRAVAETLALQLFLPAAAVAMVATGAEAARGAAEAVRVGEYTLTSTVAGKLAERPYLNSPLTLREIMAAGKPIPDPGGVAGALRWDIPGVFRGSAGTWELVVDPQSKTVLHWLFKSAPKPAP